MTPRKRPGPFVTDDESMDDGDVPSSGSHSSSVSCHLAARSPRSPRDLEEATPYQQPLLGSFEPLEHR